MNSASPKIAVVGSINMDVVVRCEKLPVPGQTVRASSAAQICGGKGANQAVAASRAGGNVSMVGRVGDDSFATRLVDNLAAESVDCSHVRKTASCASGLAIVAVEDSGQNSIMVVSGANGRVTPSDVQAAKSAITSCDVVLLQLEIPVETVLETIQLARQVGVRVILDPAPAVACLPAAMYDVDLLCPNETEAAQLTGRSVGSVADAAAAAEELRRRGVRNVAITLGARGTLLLTDEGLQLIGTFSIVATDTTAAGDAFAGAVAVHWGQHGNLSLAVRFANAAGALSASRAGAQPSMGNRSEIEALLRDGT